MKKPTLLRMREGKPGGGKGPLLSEDVSLTLTGVQDVLFYQTPQRDEVLKPAKTHGSLRAEQGGSPPLLLTPASSRASAASTSASNEPDGAPSASQRSTPTPAPSSDDTGPTCRTSETLFYSPPDKAMTTRQPPFKLTPAQVSEAVAAYEAGASVGQIAGPMGVSRQAMWDMLRRRTQMRDRLEALPRKPATAVRAKRNRTRQRYRSRAMRITAAQMRAVRERDKTCRSCGAEGTDFDHILAVSLGGQTTLENLQLLCHPCHVEKSRTDRRLAAAHRKEVTSGSQPFSGPAASRSYARTSPSPASDEAWAATPSEPTPAQDSPTPSSTLWSDTDLPSSSSRTSPVYSAATVERTYSPSPVAWSNSGTGGRFGFSTRSSSECPSAEDGSSSSRCDAVMTTLTDVLLLSAPARFSLSARAAAGIIRRSAKRGRSLPGELHTALTQLARSQQESTASPTESKSSCKDTSSPSAWTVRRLTPTECERLMGWEDGWTVVPEWQSRSTRAATTAASAPSRESTSSPSPFAPMSEEAAEAIAEYMIEAWSKE